MRCFSCDNLSIEPICQECIKEFLTPQLIKKEIGNLEVISFFQYSNTAEFIKSKYSDSGYRVYKFIAQRYFQPFIKAYVESFKDRKIYLIGVDENLNREYSNIAILTHYGAKENRAKALHNVLKAKNKVQYAGKSLEFRLENPRNFIYSGPKNIKAILIDDTVTTGSTLEEASRVLKRNGVEVDFALTIANAIEGTDY
jgi:competence protein ComFC